MSTCITLNWNVEEEYETKDFATKYEIDGMYVEVEVQKKKNEELDIDVDDITLE